MKPPLAAMAPILHKFARMRDFFLNRTRVYKGRIFLEVMVSPLFLALIFFSTVSMTIIAFSCVARVDAFMEDLGREITPGDLQLNGRMIAANEIAIPWVTDQDFLRSRCHRFQSEDAASIFRVKERIRRENRRQQENRLSVHLASFVKPESHVTRKPFSGETPVVAIAALAEEVPCPQESPVGEGFLSAGTGKDITSMEYGWGTQ
jgi:hypothetical protein